MSRVINKIRRKLYSMTMQLLRRIFYYLMSELNYPFRVSVQPLLLNGEGVVYFGKSVAFGNYYSAGYFSGYSYIEARCGSASIKVGDNCLFNNNVQIIADKESVVIEKECRIGSNFQILTSDFHGIKPNDRKENGEYKGAGVYIGENVFIGNNVTVLKGVSIGSGSVIASGSVVTISIPSECIAAGVPAKVVKVLS